MTTVEKVLLFVSVGLFLFVVGYPRLYDQKELCLSSGGTAVEYNGSFERCIK